MMTKEKYQTLKVPDLRALAKTRGISGAAAMKKIALIEAMLAEDEKEEFPFDDSGEEYSENANPNDLHKMEEKQVEAADEPEENAVAVSDKPEKKPVEAADKPKNKPTAALKKKDAKAVKTPARRGRKKSEPVAASSVEAAKAPEKIKPVSVSKTQAVPVSEIKQSKARRGRKKTDVESQEVSAVPASGQAAASDSGQTQTTPTVPADKLIPHLKRHAASQTGIPVSTATQTEEPEAEKAKEDRNAARGILEVMQDGFGFLRSDNFLPGENDIYVSPSQIRRFGLKTGDMIEGNTRVRAQGEKFGALLYVSSVNDMKPDEAKHRATFENMTPIFPCKRIRLERMDGSIATRIVDLISPIGQGQRGMIVSPPKAGKTTLLKDIAKSILHTDPDSHLIILLIDERPEEVTDMKESVSGKNVEIIYSTFDEMPEHHKRVSEMVIERAKRLVEHKKDVVILLDSITRLARAYNILVPPSGRTLSGGLDPTALYMPKRFFGAARNMREGGSLTILATALVDTGSKMDDVVYEEFKGTGNMELILDRKLQERRIFPAIDIVKSGTRREDLLLTHQELEAVNKMRRLMNGMRSDEAVESILRAFTLTKTNDQVVNAVISGRMPRG